MIDVVFLLIIFFLVSSHLARQENRLPLNLPVASTFDMLDPAKAALTITLDDAAKMRVGGNMINRQTLKQIFQDLIAREGRGAAIRIRVDGQVQYSHVEPILREAAVAGIADASIAVKEAARQ